MPDPGFLATSLLTIGLTADTTTYAVPFDDITIRKDQQNVVVDSFDPTRQKSYDLGGVGAWSINISGLFNYEVGMQKLLQYTVGGGAWSSGVMKPSDTNNKTAVTFKLYLKLDLDTDEYIVLSGCITQSLAVTAELGAPARYTATILASSLSKSTTAPVGITLTVLGSVPPFGAGLTGSEIELDDTDAAHIESFNFTITNDVAAKYAWGSADADHISLKNLKISGAFRAYYYDGTLLQDTIDQDIKKLDVQLRSPAAADNNLVILFKKAKLSAPGVGNSDGSFAIDATFNAQYDSTDKLVTFTVTTV